MVCQKACQLFDTLVNRQTVEMVRRGYKHPDISHRHEGRTNRWLFDPRGRMKYVEDRQSAVFDMDSEYEFKRIHIHNVQRHNCNRHSSNDEYK